MEITTNREWILERNEVAALTAYAHKRVFQDSITFDYKDSAVASSDGHSLLVGKVHQETGQPGRFAFPAATFRALHAAKAERITLVRDGSDFTLDGGGVIVPIRALGTAAIAPWEKVIAALRHESAATSFAVNPKLVKRMLLVAKAAGCPFVHVRMGPSNLDPVTVSCEGPGCSWGIVTMPAKNTEGWEDRPGSKVRP